MIDIIGKRYYFFALSLLIIVPGLALLGYMISSGRLPVSIDFTGGSLLEIRFTGNEPSETDLILFFNGLDVEDVKVQTTSNDSYVIRSSILSEDIRGSIVQKLGEEFNTEVTVLRFENVGPTIGREVTQRAAQAVAVAAFIVTVYMTFAFRGVPHALRFGICAIIAMVHDVAIVFSLTAIGSVLWGWQIDALFLTAVLTVIGFSVQDKVVVFDRIRENTGILRRLPFETLVNHSIVQTLQRSINTQLMTVEFMLLALALFGGVTLREFATILLVGLLSGTYSSIFIAAPILVVWEGREWRNWFKPRQSSASA
ncbi:MAG: protein translocase subunit SecF [Anaerolineae bacterium UTCFX2]|jgi:preprotein translocase subunit SecF|nr:protein translocase subunit SecF [Anaerolineae bacterium]MCZ7553874.1 protein translocase subunit SecF [Anaerolineales bacterium]OQY90867.1 MAG: protein translocase subunit SecF [Anaerolineae bacterium UTCFX2]